MAGVCCLVERLPRVQTAQISILIPPGGSVTIAPHCISSNPKDSPPTTTSSSSTFSSLPPHVHIISIDLSHVNLSSFSSPQFVEGALSIRFKIKPHHTSLTSPADPIKAGPLVERQLKILCSFCGQLLTKTAKE